MTTRSIIRVAAVALFAMSATNVQAAGDAVAGEVKANTCFGCHASPSLMNAYPTFHVPKVSGQHAAYIVAALKGYRDGDRKHGTMQANAASLSDQDMEDIAAYFAAAK